MTHQCTSLTASLIIALSSSVFLVSDAVEAQELTLNEVLARATSYVDQLHDQLMGVVMEERYEQRAWTPGVGALGGSYQRRTLQSDYLLIQPEGADRYYGFRDVFEVNGDPVRDQQDRLTELFLDPSASSQTQIQGILRDSARFNIGDVVRNTNTPTLALLFLRSEYRLRFEFTRSRNRSPRLGVDEPENVDNMWVVEFLENWSTTLIGGRNGRNLPAQGRFWLEADSGRVLVTELVLEDSEMDSTITVKYKADANLGHSVPVEMRERYANRRAGSGTDGTATYTRFRRFQVQVDESTPVRN